MNTPKPSAGAMRAAKLLAADMGPYYTGKRIAEIIDRESGLAELLEACKAAQRFFDILRERYRDVFEFNSNDADGLLDWDVQMKIQDAIAKASNPNADTKQAYPKGRYDTV